MAAKDKTTPDDGDGTAPATQPAAPQQQAQPVQIVPMPAAPPVPAKELDELPDGPRYIVNGVLVDAEGRPINEDGSLKEQPK